MGTTQVAQEPYMRRIKALALTVAQERDKTAIHPNGNVQQRIDRCRLLLNEAKALAAEMSSHNLSRHLEDELCIFERRWPLPSDDAPNAAVVDYLASLHDALQRGAQALTLSDMEPYPPDA